MRLKTAKMLAALALLAAFLTASASPAAALTPCNYNGHSANPTLAVVHYPAGGPYAHRVAFTTGYYNMARWRLFIKYPGTSWTLVHDTTQPLACWTCPGSSKTSYWIQYTPNYRPADGRYWQLFTWDPADGSRWRCGSNVVYN